MRDVFISLSKKHTLSDKHIEVIRDKGTILARQYLNKRYDNEAEEEKE